MHLLSAEIHLTWVDNAASSLPASQKKDSYQTNFLRSPQVEFVHHVHWQCQHYDIQDDIGNLYCKDESQWVDTLSGKLKEPCFLHWHALQCC